jgi:sphingomyelin phosphodiesterase acid-like 3
MLVCLIRLRSLSFALQVMFCVSLISGCDTPLHADRTNESTVSTFDRDDRVLIIADVHLDPFDRGELVDRLADAPLNEWESIFSSGPAAKHLSTYGHDANATLFLSSLRAMHQALPHPSYVLLAGDLLGHNFRRHFKTLAKKNDEVSYRRFVDKTSDFIRYELTTVYPHTQIFPTIGNNDGYCGDYASTPHDAYLAHQAAEWAPIIDPDKHFPNIESTFARGGYYRAETPDGLRIVSLNSVFLAKTYHNACGVANEQPAEEELKWLHREFELTEPAKPSIVLTHVPMGIDGFKTFFHLGFPVPLLKPEYQTALRDEIDAPKHAVATMITGHLHDVGYRQTDEGKKDNVPIVVMPSVSPIFGNTPAFTVAWISKRGVIDDMAVHRFQSAPGGATNWINVLDFNSRYGLHGVTADGIEKLHLHTGTDRLFRAVVERDSVGNAPVLAITTLDRKALWCTSGALTPEAFLHCTGADH